MTAKSGKRKSVTSRRRPAGLRTFAVDVGGTGIKSVLLNATGKAISNFQRVKTPHPATPKAILSVIAEMAKAAGKFDRVALGFPGVVRNGRVQTAPHLDPKWVGVDLEKSLEKELGKPARVGNDAAVQGFAAISGKGIEMVITLGTSMGASLYVNGQAIPNEMGHHPYSNGKTYEDEIGEEARKRAGKSKWNKRLQKVIEQLDKTFNYDRLYIGGGNAKRISFKLPKNARIIDNTEGLYGTLALWKQ
jgi:polyphosphate glucokinase